MDATALAEYLVQKGVAFRQAHGIVGSLVKYCEQQNKNLSEIGLEELQKYSTSIDKDVYENLGAKRVVVKYITAGSAGPKQAKEQIAYWNNHLGQR